MNHMVKKKFDPSIFIPKAKLQSN